MLLDIIVEVDGGDDGDGFYLDIYDGDKGMVYILGLGYVWVVENNDVIVVLVSSVMISFESVVSELNINSSDSSCIVLSVVDYLISLVSISDVS